MEQILSILSKELEKRDLSVYKFSKQTGIPKDRVYKWFQGQGSPKSDDSAKIKNWIEKGVVEEVPAKTNPKSKSNDISIKKFTKMRLALKYSRAPIPVTNTKAAAGSVILYNDEPEIILEYVEIPFVGNTDGAIEVVGESMYPTLKNGSRIAVAKIEDKTLIHPGYIYYILDKNHQGVVKRLYKGKDENHIKLSSDNPDKETYPPYELHLSKVLAIFKVQADITKH